MKSSIPQPSMPERQRLGTDTVPLAQVAAEKRRLERLAQIHGVSRKTAAQIATAFFAGSTQPVP